MSKETVVRDRSDNILARYREQASGEVLVYDAYMNLQGRATDAGTFDGCHNLVSHQKEPGLLVRKVR